MRKSHWYKALVGDADVLSSYKELVDYTIPNQEKVTQLCDEIRNMSRGGTGTPAAIDLDQITKDVYRTRIKEPLFSIHPSVDRSTVNLLNPETIQEIMARILFVYREIQGVSYAQGMNELLAPLVATAFEDDVDKQRGEAEAYAMFCGLMARHDGAFADANLMSASSAIAKAIGRFDVLLRNQANDVYQHFRKIGLELHLISLRWFLLLFAQDFELSDCLVLWDAILTIDSHKRFLAENNIIFFVALAILIERRDHILSMTDSFTLLKTLQQCPHVNDVPSLIERAKYLQKKQQTPQLKNMWNELAKQAHGAWSQMFTS